jgi:hypothetical protein
MHFFYDNPEDVVIGQVFSNTQFEAYFQHTHSAGADFEIDTIAAQPCSLALTYQQFVLVAGDPNNPHIIYRSKGDTPEAFTVTPADGSISTVACGTPSNPIMAFTILGGEIVTLNLYGIFVTLLLSGSFIPANQVAYRGLVGRRAWCQTTTEVWFLSTDGVYSFDGSSCRKRSSQIEPIFHGQEIDNFLPLSYLPAAIEQCVMETRRGQVFLLYDDVSGNSQQIVCDPAFNDRWRAKSPGNPALEFMYTEPDTGSMIEARFNPAPNIGFSVSDQVVVAAGINYTSDGFTPASPPNPPTGGSPIAFDMRLPWFDMGTPQLEKDFEEIFLELDTSNSANGTATLAVDILYDFSDTAVASDTAVITVPNNGRSLVSLLTALQSVITIVQSYGRESRAISFHIYGSAYPTRMTFYSLIFTYQETAMLTAGGATDWQNLGGNFDKRVYEMTVEFDTRGINQTIALDIISGIGSGIPTMAQQTFILNNPVISGPGRAQQTFALQDQTIFKLVRVRQYATAAAVGDSSTVFFKIFSVTFPVIEQFPPDVVTSTPWKTATSITDENPSWLGIDADTAGVPATINLQNETGTVLTVQHTGTVGNRRANYPIPVDQFAKMWRLLNQVGPSEFGKLQLFAWSFDRWQPTALESGVHPPATVTWLPWKNATSPTDKNPTWLAIDAFTNSVAASVNLVNERGIVMTIEHNGTTTNRVALYPIPVDQFAKMWRLLVTPGVGGVFQCWNWWFQRWEATQEVSGIDPPDVIFWTPWTDFGWAYGSIAQNLTVTMDTNGVECLVSLETEAGILQSFPITTTYDSRRVTLAVNANTIGLQWRLILTPGPNGKSKLWSWALELVKLPPNVNQWQSNETGLGYKGWHYIKQVWVQYQGPSPLTITLTSDTGTYTVTLPAHPNGRSAERFYPPTVWGNGLNKSKISTFSWVSASPCRVFPELSGVEWIACGADRHAAYHQTSISEFTKLPI